MTTRVKRDSCCWLVKCYWIGNKTHLCLFILQKEQTSIGDCLYLEHILPLK